VEVQSVSERDARYDASKKGLRRRKRFEQSPARREYARRWLKAYRKRMKAKGKGAKNG
jgi:hypothetical protein